MGRVLAQRQSGSGSVGGPRVNRQQGLLGGLRKTSNLSPLEGCCSPQRAQRSRQIRPKAARAVLHHPLHALCSHVTPNAPGEAISQSSLGETVPVPKLCFSLWIQGVVTMGGRGCAERSFPTSAGPRESCSAPHSPHPRPGEGLCPELPLCRLANVNQLSHSPRRWGQISMTWRG